ncbi:MAG: hypothetical protein C0483_06505 [Pirellula sp.]|nr:hypothetical protein [Pirellula sp.]
MNDDLDKPRYWFPAKTYGWGWGFPLTWEGWAVMLSWIVLLLLGSTLLVERSLPAFFVFEAVMVTLLLVVCYVKGEPPRWRWGDKDRPKDRGDA